MHRSLKHFEEKAEHWMKRRNKGVSSGRKEWFMDRGRQNFFFKRIIMKKIKKHEKVKEGLESSRAVIIKLTN